VRTGSRRGRLAIAHRRSPTRISAPLDVARAAPVAALLRRALRLLVSPVREWEAIAAEGASWRSVGLTYVLPLSALPAVAWMIGRLLFPADLVTWESGPLAPSFTTIVRAGAIAFCGSIVSVAALAGAFHLLAPTYGAQRDWTRSWKVAAYGTTPVWLAGVLLVKPILVGLLLVALLHCSYLYYAGLQVVAGVKRSGAAECVAIALFLSSLAATVLGAVFAGGGS
jgi:Yip1 domain